jgi:NADH-quinone oxidoreductase subunit G
VGAYIANANGARRQLQRTEKAYLLLNAEPELDAYNPQALPPRWKAEMVVVMSPSSTAWTTPTCCCRSRRSAKPRAPSSTPKAVHRASTAPSSRCWKPVLLESAARAGQHPGPVGLRLRHLGSDPRRSAGRRRDRRFGQAEQRSALRSGRAGNGGTERIADVPIYFADAVVRRAESLQRRPMRLRRKRTCRQRWPSNWVWPPATRSKSPKVPAAPSWSPPSMPNCQPTPCVAAHASTAALGGMFGSITVEKAGEGEIMALPEFVTTINTMGANSVLALLAAVWA